MRLVRRSVFGKRARLARVLDSAGFTSWTLRARRYFPLQNLTVLNYHRLVAPGSPVHVDEGVIDTTPAAFDRQLGILRRHFNPICLDDLRQHLAGARPLPPNPALVTFDDGYLDNFTLGLPILRSHQMRAAFFIPTDYLTRRRVFWWDRISYTLKNARRKQFVIEYPCRQELDLTRGVKLEERRLHNLVKTTFALDLPRYLDELMEAAETPWTEALEEELTEELLMTWNQVRELRRAGMDIGSHTRTHRVLQTVPPEQLPGELAGSRADLEAELGEPVFALAAPVGDSIGNFPEIKAAVKAAGYSMNFAYCAGKQPLRKLDPFDIRRVPVERDWDDSHFSAVLAFPRFAH